MKLGNKKKKKKPCLHSPLKNPWVIQHFGTLSNTWHRHLGLTLLHFVQGGTIVRSPWHT